ncbi:MAG: SBBP repeat-containing protein [Candidatus Solibacter sp.]|nr:SBBP repeat-containing protein [Candidatus Solibacter sp.]
MAHRTSCAAAIVLLSLCGGIAHTRAIPGTLRPLLHFEPNVGQHAPEVRYVSRAPGYLIALGCGGRATYGLEKTPGEFSYITMNLEGAPGCPEGEPHDQQSSFTNYYAGNAPQDWHVGVPEYTSIRFPGVYSGVDMLWLARRSGVEYQFHLAPGSDANRIRLRIEGATEMHLDGSGNLVIETAAGPLSHRAPRAYQLRNGKRRTIPAAYTISGNLIGLELADYDTRFATVIDPLVAFSSYLGGSGWDVAYGIAVDSSGCAYVTGETTSGAFLTAGYNPGLSAGRHVFIAKLSSDGSRVLYTTILASSGQDSGRAIAVDASGSAYVAGVFGGGGFPQSGGTVTWAGMDDAFVARLDPSGRLVSAMAMGGAGTDVATGVAVGSVGNVYLSGYTNSVAFPTTAGAPQRVFGGGSYDAFVAKIDLSSNTLVYSTLLGGPGNDLATAVAVDASGQSCIAGYTDSANLPVRNAVQAALSGFGDAFIACLTPAGTAWNMLTYLGGRSTEQANGIAIDSSGIYVTGSTLSSDFPVPAGSVPAAGHGDYDVFVAKLQTGTPRLIYSTLIGGSGADASNAIAVDSRGQAWVAGFTGSVDFPVVGGSGFSGGFDAWLAGVASDGRTVVFSTLLGGPGDDRALALAIGGSAAYLTGLTVSGSFPVTASAYQSTPPQGVNAFVAKIQTAANQAPTAVSVNPASGSGATQNFTFTFSDPDGTQDIDWFQVLVAPVSSGPVCNLHYSRAANTLWLYNDNYTAALGPVTPGQATTVQNSQCTINGTGSAVTASGNTLAITVALVFKPAFVGAKTISLYAQDLAGASTGGWRSLGTWSVPGVMNQPPTAVSVNPASGSGAAQTFTFTFSDPDGAQDIDWFQVLIAPVSSGPVCNLHYSRAANTLWLYNDSYTAALGPVTPGQGATVQNSQCTINGTGSAVTASGSTLALTVALVFKPAFAGSKIVNLYAQDAAGASTTSWRALGSWTVN